MVYSGKCNCGQVIAAKITGNPGAENPLDIVCKPCKTLLARVSSSDKEDRVEHVKSESGKHHKKSPRHHKCQCYSKISSIIKSVTKSTDSPDSSEKTKIIDETCEEKKNTAFTNQNFEDKTVENIYSTCPAA